MLFKKSILAVLGVLVVAGCTAGSSEPDGTTATAEDRIRITDTSDGRLIQAYDEHDVLTAEILVRPGEMSVTRNGRTEIVSTKDIDPAQKEPTGGVQIQTLSDCSWAGINVAAYCSPSFPAWRCRMASFYYLTYC